MSNPFITECLYNRNMENAEPWEPKQHVPLRGTIHFTPSTHQMNMAMYTTPTVIMMNQQNPYV